MSDPSHYDVANGRYEDVVVAWLRNNIKPGDTFWDVGANVGFYSILAARLTGPNGFVVAIEADPRTAAVLKKNFELNNVNHGAVISGAITDHSGTVRLGRAPASGWTGLFYEKADEWIEVPAFTADALMECLRPAGIHALKIDVEGAEGTVLAGMRGLLTQMRPLLLIEVHRTHNGVEDEVLETLRSCDFESEILDRPDVTIHLSARPSLRSVFTCNQVDN